MCSNNIILYRIVLLLWVLCVAVCEHQKRDVHRIVIEERVPRSHKKGQQHGHSHTQNKGNGHSPKKTKGKNPHKNQGSDSSSYEDSDSHSKENSYEDIFYGRQVQKPHYKKKTSQNRPSYPRNLGIEESRHHQNKKETKHNFDSEWVPLNPEQILQHSQENYRNKYKRKKRKQEGKTKGRKQNSKNTNLYVLEHTTSYPLLQFDTSSTLYPPLSLLPGTFSDYNGKLLEPNQSPLLSIFEQPKLDFSNSKGSSDRLRNHRTGYDVKEADDSDIGTFILVPDSNSEANPDKDLRYQLKATQAQKSTRNRGSITFSETANF